MTESETTTRIDGLFLGQVQSLWADRPSSAIQKTPAQGRQDIVGNGFVNDAQADLENHGGMDKAIHHYPSDHYAAWIAEGAMPQGTAPAAFGENIASLGMTEQTMCIGDILRLGTALVQISQGRQPCWKVAEHTRNPKMAYLFRKTGRTGWYYRVLDAGYAEDGAVLRLVERPQPAWSVARVTAARLRHEATAQELAQLAVLPELAEEWRAGFANAAR